MSAPPSPSIPSTAASSRTTSPTGSTRQAPPPSSSTTSRRPNRAALRDYYNLKSTAPPSSSDTPPTLSPTHSTKPTGPSTPSTPTTPSAPSTSALDNPSFSPENYISTLLSRSSLSDILRTESHLINEIKGLDGERKALVYDNYSKLITATDTIRRMRRDMDMGSEREMMAGKEGVLGPAVGHIAAVVGELRGRGLWGGNGERKEEEAGGRRQRERDTVRWVVQAPKRLGEMVEEGRREEAEEDWAVVRGLLGRWEGVDGVGEVRGECERAMGG